MVSVKGLGESFGFEFVLGTLVGYDIIDSRKQMTVSGPSFSRILVFSVVGSFLFVGGHGERTKRKSRPSFLCACWKSAYDRDVQVE